MKDELKKALDAAKTVGDMTLDTIELLLIARGAEPAQRKAAEAYIHAFEEQHGTVKSPEDWKLLYNGVKKRLTV
ncbi:hypothetical protein SEA_ENYGMA_224 [Streptomyces phage Enygma]